MKMKALPSQLELKELFEYRDDGNLIRKTIPKQTSVKIGDVAGCVNKLGYRTIWVNGVAYLAHRLIWVYHNGAIPIDLVIDHIKPSNPCDNSIINLQPVPVSKNAQKKKTPSSNKSGFKGVCWNKNASKWRANININGKTTHLGYFVNIMDAAIAYDNAAIKYFGEYANTNFNVDKAA